MPINRRNFLKIAPISALIPAQVFGNITDNSVVPNLENEDSAVLESTLAQIKSDKIYDEAIVIDGIVITRNWDSIADKALAQSGYTGFNASLDSGSLKRALKSLSDWNTRIKENPNRFIQATSADDFVRAKKEDKAAVMMGFQNTTMLEKSIENMDVLYEAGTRWMQLTYNPRNLVGDGCTERTNAGLSDYGIEVVERMNELGIIVDLSHCGQQTTDDGIKFSTSGASINHSMCEALHKNHPRAKTDAQIRAMADKGGVIGIICLGYMIGPNLGTETTLETYVDHIEHAVKVGGIDHVGLAADFAVQGLEATGATRENWYEPRLTRFKPSYKVQWPPWIPELDSPDRYRHVTRLLTKRGFSAVAIEKILGGNWLRYFRETLKT